MQDTICWSCGRACTKTCSWSSEFIPVDGWDAEYNERYDSYRVDACPMFVPDNDEEWELDERGALEMIQRLLEVTRDDYIHCPRLQPEIEKFLRGKGASKVHMIDDAEAAIRRLKRDFMAYQRKRANKTMI